MNKKPEIVRVYLPPDANTLLSTYDHCLRSRAVRQRRRRRQAAAVRLAVGCRRRRTALRPRCSASGSGPAPTDGRGDTGRRARVRGRRPDARDARGRRRSCASSSRTCGSASVNVVDLMRLLPESEHPHGLSDREFDTLFTTTRADRVRVPRLPVAHPPSRLPPRQPRAAARPRLQGERHDHDAVRHGHAQRPRPLPPRDRRDRPGARPRRARGRPPPGDGRCAVPCACVDPGSTARTSRRSRAGDGTA